MKSNQDLDFNLDDINVDIDLNSLGIKSGGVKLQGIVKKEKPKVVINSKKEQKAQRIAQSAKVNTYTPSLTATQDKAIDLWLEGYDKAGISRELSVPLETINEWFKDQRFNKYLEDTREECQSVYQNRIDKLTPLAIQRIEEIIKSPENDKVALMACDKVLKASGILSSNNSNTTINKGTQIIINSKYEANNLINDNEEDDFVEMEVIELDEKERAMIENN